MSGGGIVEDDEDFVLRSYIVSKHESISSVALKFDMTLPELCLYNPQLSRYSTLSAGQVLKVKSNRSQAVSPFPSKPIPIASPVGFPAEFPSAGKPSRSSGPGVSESSRKTFEQVLLQFFFCLIFLIY